MDIRLTAGLFYIDVPIVYYSPFAIRMSGILANEDSNSAYTITDKQGTVILPSNSYMSNGYYTDYMFNYAASTSTDNNDGYVELDHFLIRGIPDINGFPASITHLANMIEFGVYVGSSGLSPGVIINTPVRKFIHDIKFNFGGYGINSYDSGGPSIYERLHFTYMGYTDGTTINNQTDMYIVDVDATLRDVEFFSSFNLYQINQQYVTSAVPNGTMSIDGAYFGNNRGNANIRSGYYLKISNIYQTNTASISPAPAQLISIEDHSSYISLSQAVIQSAAAFTSYNSPSTATKIIADNVFLDNSTSYNPQLTIQQGSTALISGSILEYKGKLGTIVYGSITNLQLIPGVTSLSTNPPATATVYQNTNPYDIRIYLPAYASTSGTAGTVAIALGSSSSPSTIGTRYISGSTSSSSTDILELVVPAGWYYEFTLTGVTLGTATVFSA
jgi:hypothetical protein